MKWKTKFINIDDAREISKMFCKHFNLPYCNVYLIDEIRDAYGIYSWLEPYHILIEQTCLNPIGILIHELTHHLEFVYYANNNCFLIMQETPHGYLYQLAKRRVITWARKNISKKAEWNVPLKCKQFQKDMKKFRL